MKFTATFKTPNAIEFATEFMSFAQLDEAKATAEKFVRNGEYVTIEFDTETQTAKVLPA